MNEIRSTTRTEIWRCPVENLSCEVVLYWYPPPHSCWRVEVESSTDLDYELQNLTVDEAWYLGKALVDARRMSSMTLTFDVPRNVISWTADE